MNKNVNVTVVELSKWGYKDQEGFVSLSKKLPEGDKARLVPGATFEAEYYVADSGTRYLNKIVAITPTQPKAAPVTDINPPVDQERARKFTPKFTKKVDDAEKMTKADWNAKDRSQLIGGLSHDAATITAQMVNIDSLNKDSALALYQYLLEGMLKIREEVK